MADGGRDLGTDATLTPEEVVADGDRVGPGEPPLFERVGVGELAVEDELARGG